jgi:hypothetical protein
MSILSKLSTLGFYTLVETLPCSFMLHALYPVISSCVEHFIQMASSNFIHTIAQPVHLRTSLALSFICGSNSSRFFILRLISTLLLCLRLLPLDTYHVYSYLAIL